MSTRKVTVPDLSRGKFIKVPARAEAVDEFYASEPIEEGRWITHENWFSLRAKGYSDYILGICSFFKNNGTSDLDGLLPITIEAGATYFVGDKPENMPLDENRMFEEKDFRKATKGCEVILMDSEGSWMRFIIQDYTKPEHIEDYVSLMKKPVKMLIKDPLK